MFGELKTICKDYPKEIWWMSLVAFIFVARKTVFNVNRVVGDFSTSIDASTSLALLGIFLTTILMIKYMSDVKIIHRELLVFLLYSYFTLISFLWAGNNSFVPILFKSTEVLVNIILMGLIVYKIESPKGQLLYIILFSTIVTYMDAFFDNRGWWGFHHGNAYPFSAMIGSLLSLSVVRMRIFNLSEMAPFFLLNFIAWLGGTSTASYISLIIGCVVLYSFGSDGFRFWRTLIICIAVIAIYNFLENHIYAFLTKGHTSESIYNMTGRQFIWDAALKSWKQNPWLGKGFIIGERSLKQFGLGINVLSAHNTYVSVIVNTGIVGFVIFANFVIKWIRTIYLYGKISPYASVLFPIVVALLINTGSAPIIGSDNGHISPCAYLLISYSFINFHNSFNLTEKEADDESTLL